MTVQLARSRAETALGEEFAKVEQRLPGNAAVARLRREAIGRFAAMGLPHRRVEDWKYTDLRALLKEAAPLAAGGYEGEIHLFVEHALDSSLKCGDQSGDWMLFADGRMVAADGALKAGENSLARVLESPPDWLVSLLQSGARAETDGVQALNTAFLTDGLVLDIADGARTERPLHAVFAAGRRRGDEPSAAAMVVTRNVVRIGRDADVVLVESHVGSAGRPRQTNTLTQIVLGDGARLTHVIASDRAAAEVHLANVAVALGARAEYRPFIATSGAGTQRHQLAIALSGEHGRLDLGAMSLGSATGHADLSLLVDHAVAHCTSRELFKTVLTGESKAAFQGKVVVRPGAQKTDGKQMAQALLLSPFAEFDSKPELEIYADDVVCGHGSTSADIDDDLLFYCRSRGIPLAEARALLVESFIGEAIDKVDDEGLRAVLAARATAWLAASAA